MKRVVVYSDSSARLDGSRPAAAAPSAPSSPSRPADSRRRWLLRIAAIAAIAVAAGALFWLAPRGMDAAQVDFAVQRALDAVPPSPTAADAYEKILPSVVHVRAYYDASPEPRRWKKHEDTEEPASSEGSIGTGVVIVETGVILTNLHVVNGAKRIEVTFFDGTKSEADVTGARAQDDLAVLQAKKIPDDLQPATMRSTAGLRPGEAVVAVGFPFGIGPSATSGVVSGLKREYEAQGKKMLSNLIQFDAAVNPGNSGGPLVTLEGEVVGIVTGLLNPTEQRVFVGIGFAVPIENAARAAGLNPF